MIKEMKSETKQQQIDRVSVSLQELASQITEADKGFVMFNLNKSIDTVRRYLKGEVANLETGVRMIEILRQRIKERQAA